MTVVLGLDSSGPDSSAALLVGGDLVAVQGSDTPRAHAAYLSVLIERCLTAAGLAVADIGLVAAARGPGLFTGLRVGLVTAGVFAHVREIPAVGISTLDAVALRAREVVTPDSDFVVVTDARRREVFWARYAADGALREGPAVDRPATLLAEDGPWQDIDPGHILGDTVALGPGVGRSLVRGALAAEVGRLAAAIPPARHGEYPLAPLYLRRPDVTPSPLPQIRS